MTKTLTPDEIVRIIRTDAKVGRGSCTAIDECYDDAELAESFAGFTTRAAVLREAYRREDVQIDRMLDQRFGDDSDAELQIAAEWRNSRGETKSQAKVRRAKARRALRKRQRDAASWLAAAGVGELGR